MRLIREILINDAADFNLTVEFGATRPRAMTVQIYANAADPLNLFSQDELGNVLRHVSAAELIGTGPGHSFGGPVGGQFVGIDWQGSGALKRGRFQFWDEPIRPYGFLEIGRSTEAGIAPAALSVEVQYDFTSDWFNSFQFLCTGTQANALTLGLESFNVSQSLQTIGAQAAGAIFNIQSVMGSISGLNAQTTNSGAANMTWATRLVAYVS